MGTDCVGAKRF